MKALTMILLMIASNAAFATNFDLLAKAANAAAAENTQLQHDNKQRVHSAGRGETRVLKFQESEDGRLDVTVKDHAEPSES